MPTLFMSLFTFRPTCTIKTCSLRYVLSGNRRVALDRIDGAICVDFRGPNNSSRRDNSIVGLSVPSNRTGRVLTTGPKTKATSFALHKRGRSVRNTITIGCSRCSNANSTCCAIVGTVKRRADAMSYGPNAVGISEDLLRGNVGNINDRRTGGPSPSRRRRTRRSAAPPFGIRFNDSIDGRN